MSLKAVVLLPVMVVVATLASAAVHGASQRDVFLETETLIAKGHVDDARKRMPELAGYPLLGHLELALADARLATLPHEHIIAVLRRHADVPGATALRRKWLARLAREGRHELVLQHHDDDGHRPSACLAAQASWRTGHSDEAWQRVTRLWQTGRSLPDDCDAVLAAWRAAGELTPALAWTRFALAMERNNVRLARYLRRFITVPDDRALADDWLRLRDAPSGIPRFARETPADSPKRSRVLRHVFTRAARRDSAAARALWPSIANAGLAPDLLGALRESLGEVLARERAPDALDWLQQARGARALGARAVEGIRIGDLEDVAAAVAAMPQDEAARERWRFWGARALGASDPASARERLQSLAAERSYYGFLAADHVGAGYAWGHAAIDVDSAELDALAARPAAVRAREWLALERADEARREWAVLLAALDTRGQQTAARLAHRWNWPEAAIRAAAAARHWSDLEVRFPLAHGDAVSRAAGDTGLPASRVYAVIRQESAFMRDIRSRAGALGLMQLMPATARQVAHRAGLPRPDRDAILEPERNLLLGSLYLRRLEQRYDGHRVLATAAYNAGPGRVRQWRPRGAATSSEVWIETIPFRETRRYVRRVLAYQAIYAHRLGTPEVKLSELMPPVPPA